MYSIMQEGTAVASVTSLLELHQRERKKKRGKSKMQHEKNLIEDFFFLAESPSTRT